MQKALGFICEEISCTNCISIRMHFHNGRCRIKCWVVVTEDKTFALVLAPRVDSITMGHMKTGKGFHAFPRIPRVELNKETCHIRWKYISFSSVP
ncbi:hypothetical protein L6164_019182 [Bauhinia variegata]|uniref:Uncharacterized protein n=1 Tax=Bauhinia variegata TaxID=167791 RepID=A0ACB9NDT0_BAUVA|nr:hypothetical protein L6164_019182 [Bauhinia variegata]